MRTGFSDLLKLFNGNKVKYLFAHALLLLFLIQLAGTLVESIYILDLLNTSLDEKALGLLFFFSPALLLALPRGRSIPGWLIWLLYLALLVARGLLPSLNTAGRLLASGVGASAALLLLPALLAAKPKGDSSLQDGFEPAAGLALAVGLSVMLRSLQHSLDLSLAPEGAWIGWALGLLLGLALLRLEWVGPPTMESTAPPPTLPWFGFFLAFTLAYFAFSAPAVLARWTGGSAPLIVLATGLLALGWAGAALLWPGLWARLGRSALLAWNLLFTLALAATLLAQRVPFPPTPESPAVVVGPPTLLKQAPMYLMLVLFPVIFVDLARFARQIRQSAAAPRAHVAGLLLGALALVLLVFMHIFTNVWGYVAPVSTPFRNQFWLPYALPALGLALLSARRSPSPPTPAPATRGAARWGWIGLLGVIFVLTVFGVLRSDRISTRAMARELDSGALVVMTYNLQQANDIYGEKSYERQLELIRRASPDVLALQENDSARLGLNNNDYVRYFASRLGYYSYYGPSTVSGTYGTALLSRYPLQNPRTLYIYSDRDEIAVTEAELAFDGRLFTLYNVHPDGSDTAMLAFAQTLLARAAGKEDVIALGDYNLRDYEEAYRLIDAEYTNAWTGLYPGEISPQGVDMSGENRIDHIFVSPHLQVQEAFYVLPPESATDHPVHWAVITWE